MDDATCNSVLSSVIGLLFVLVLVIVAYNRYHKLSSALYWYANAKPSDDHYIQFFAELLAFVLTMIAVAAIVALAFTGPDCKVAKVFCTVMPPIAAIFIKYLVAVH